MASRANPWAQGLSNLGTALFGSAQEDAALAQAQAEMARRQKLMSERRMAEQAFNIEQGQNRALQRVMEAAVAADPNNSGYLPTAQQYASQAIGLGQDPETLAQSMRLGANLGGGDYGTLARTFTDPGDIADAQDRMQVQAQTQALIDQYPELGTFMANMGVPSVSELPEFGQQAVALRTTMGAPFQDALAAGTDLRENVADPVTGNIYSIPGLFGPDMPVIPITDSRDRYRTDQGLAPFSMVGQAQAGGTPNYQLPGRYSQAAPPASAADAMAAGTGGPAAPPAAPAPQAAPSAARQQTPAAPTVQAPPAQAAGPEQGALAEGSGAEPAVNVQRASDSDPLYGGMPSGIIQTEAGQIRVPVGQNNEPIGMFDMLGYAGGLGAGFQRGLTATFGQASDDFTFLMPTIAKAQLEELRTALRPLHTVSNRPSQWELQSLEAMFPGAGMTDNPKANMVLLARLYYNVQAGKQSAESRLATDPLSPTEQKELNAAIRHADGVLRLIGEPKTLEGNPLSDRFGEIADAFRSGRPEAQARAERALRDMLGAGESAPADEPAINISDEERAAFENLTPEQRALFLGEGG